MPVTKITAIEAKELHVNYLLNSAGGSPIVTQAVLFDFEELNEAIQQAFGKDDQINRLMDSNYGFIVYYGRYNTSAPSDKANRNTLIIQFIEKKEGNWFAISDEIYNFGDLKPPKIIFSEQVTP
jgi:hypothetical protein